MSGKATIPLDLPTFTFWQVAVNLNEFRGLPGLEVRALGEKIMRSISFLGPGGHRKCGMWIAECALNHVGFRAALHST